MPLAAKEHELAIKRCTAIRDGPGACIRALMECSWVWPVVSKEALRVLEDTETEPGIFIYTNCPQKNQDILPSNNPRECDNHHHALILEFLLHWVFSARLTGDAESCPRGTTFLQSPLRTIHSIMYASTFGEPVSPSIATTTTVAAPAPPAESNTARPHSLSHNSTTTTTGSSMRNSVATPATYALETIIFAQTIPLRFGAVVTKEKGKTKKGHIKREPLHAHLVSDVQR